MLGAGPCGKIALDPDRRITGRSIESDAVKAGRKLPLLRLSGAIVLLIVSGVAYAEPVAAKPLVH
jgi:hypothetical protein